MKNNHVYIAVKIHDQAGEAGKSAWCDQAGTYITYIRVHIRPWTTGI